MTAAADTHQPTWYARRSDLASHFARQTHKLLRVGANKWPPAG